MSIISAYITANEEALDVLVRENAELGSAILECLAGLSVIEKEKNVSFTADEELRLIKRISDIEKQEQTAIQQDEEEINVADTIAEIQEIQSEKKTIKDTKTAIEWFEMLPKEIGERALYYLNRDMINIETTEFQNIREALNRAFDWGKTDEGFDYWNNIDDLIRGYTPLSELPLPPKTSTPPKTSKPSVTQQQQTAISTLVSQEDLERLDKITEEYQDIDITDEDLELTDEDFENIDFDI